MTEKINILIVADTFYPKVDGTLKFIEQFVERSKETFAISLLVPRYGKNEGLKVQNISFAEISKRIQLSGYQSIKLNWKNFRTIKKAIKETDVVFVQGPALLSYLALYYGRRFKKKMVFYLHVITWELFSKFLPPKFPSSLFRLFRRISIALYNRCDQLFVPYHEVGDELREKGITVPIHVTKLGVDINRFSPAKDMAHYKRKCGIDPKKFVVGYVGRVSREKNVPILLEGFRRLQDQENVHLLIVGDGPQDQVAACKELPNCSVSGFVDNVQDYLNAMDVFVMPSLTETTSLATLEAMSCGVPVIVSKVGFMKKYVVKDYNGSFFAKNSASMLSMKIQKIREDDAFRQMLGHNARKTIAYGFSWERSINRIKRLLRRLFFE